MKTGKFLPMTIIFIALFSVFAFILPNHDGLFAQDTAPATETTVETAGDQTTVETAGDQTTVKTAGDEPVMPLTPAQTTRIENYIMKQMDESQIPGLSVVIVKGDQTVFKKGFGFADVEKGEKVTSSTMFELASCTKAITGLAILHLEARGKLKLTDPVQKYIPWFAMQFKGKPVPIILANLMFQNSGIPYYDGLDKIEPSTADDAIEVSVRRIVDELYLFNQPGTLEAYSTVNFAVLGLVIQKVSGQSYEEYVRENILIPLGLKDTVLFREEALKNGLAVGYKLSLGNIKAYDAPMYRGNTPAGYAISNGDDMARWLKIQLGTADLSSPYKEMIPRSHETNPLTPGSTFGVGWRTFSYNYPQRIYHSGANPNYGCFVVFNRYTKYGVVVMANLSSGYVNGTAQGIMDILADETIKPSYDGLNGTIDFMSRIFVWVLCVVSLLVLYTLYRQFKSLILGRTCFSMRGKERLVGFLGITALVALVWFVVNLLPALLKKNISLELAMVWMPYTFTYAIYAAAITIGIIYITVLMALFFPKKEYTKVKRQFKV